MSDARLLRRETNADLMRRAVQRARLRRYAVIGANDEVFAITETKQAAEEARLEAALYLREAASCGHPRAPGWVAEHEPLRIEVIDAERARELREDGTPVLEREP